MDGEAAPAEGEATGESDISRFMRYRQDQVENAHDLNFGEDDEVKSNPKYKTMMDQILGRDWDTEKDQYDYNKYKGGDSSTGRYNFDGHGGADAMFGRGVYHNGEYSSMDQRDGWEGKGARHGEYNEYDPNVDHDGDGDDKEHEGYYPSSHESEEKEYLNDLYRRDYKANWNDRGVSNRNYYGDGEAAAAKGAEGAEAVEPTEGEAAPTEEASADEEAPVATMQVPFVSDPKKQVVSDNMGGSTSEFTFAMPKNINKGHSALVSDDKADEDNLFANRVL